MENQQPDDERFDKPDIDKGALYRLWLSADEEGRELLRWLFHAAGLPVPSFPIPEPKAENLPLDAE